MTITENFERFRYLNFEINLSKTQTLFKKLEYRCLVESTKTDNITFPYKTALSEASVKTNRMGSIKWSFASNSVLSFFENFVSVEEPRI